MTRNLLAATVLALSATLAHADNGYVFDDPYWKRAQATQAERSSEAGQAQSETRGKYDHVDRYNP